MKKEAKEATKIRSQAKKSGRKILNKFATAALLVSMTISPLFGDMHYAVEKMKRKIENPKKTEAKVKQTYFLQRLDLYTDDFAKAWLIAESFSGLDDTLKAKYFDEMIQICDSMDNPANAFSTMCMMLGNNYGKIDDKQAEKALIRAIQYGEAAMKALPKDSYDMKEEYKEGIDYLRILLKKLIGE